MSWYRYGLTPSDWTFVVNADGVTPNLATASLTAWNAESGGTQLQIAADSGGTTLVGSVASSDGTDGFVVGTVPTFYTQSPSIWLDGGAGFRTFMTSTDAADIAVQNVSDISDLQDRATSQDSILALAPVVLVEVAGVWPARPTVNNVAFWIGPTQPTAGGTGMRDGDEWHRTAS